MKKTVRDGLLAIALACGLQGPASAVAAAGPPVDNAPATLAFDSCSWDHPGVNPFMGDVVAAVDRYRDIPPAVRERLKARMARREYDDLVSIRRDRIDGRGGYDYGSTIREMHFGTHQLCRSVTRSSWSPTMEERGLVYCEGGQCILVPTVCRNVSRITRRGVGDEVAEAPPLLALAPPGAQPGVGDAAVPAELPPIDWFGPTGAGMPGDPALSEAGGFGGDGDSAAGAILAGGVAPMFAIGGVVSPGAVLTGVPAAVPEPQTWALVLCGLAALLLARRVRRVSRRAEASGSAR